jgi:ppGpp synthetase/RelA/SpoT-type nucleotidyltranferase
MDINYFLLCKKKYNNILSYFENIINECDDIINELITNMQQKNDDNIYEHVKTQLSNIYTLKNQYIQEKERINYLIKECISNIQKLCNHQFVNDSIDITPEFSEKICYCTLCEYTI